MGASGPPTQNLLSVPGATPLSISGKLPPPLRNPRTLVAVVAVLIALVFVIAALLGVFGGGATSPSGPPRSTTPPPSETSLGLDLELGVLYQGPGTRGTVASQGCTSGDYCYSVEIAASYDNVTPADFLLSVWNLSAQENLSTTVGFAILNASGVVFVSSPGPVESEWVAGAGNSNMLLTAGMRFVADMGSTNPNEGAWALDLTGVGAYAGAGTFSVGL